MVPTSSINSEMLENQDSNFRNYLGLPYSSSDSTLGMSEEDAPSLAKEVEFLKLQILSAVVSPSVPQYIVTKNEFFSSTITLSKQGQLFLDADNKNEIKSWFKINSNKSVVTYSDGFTKVATYAEAERYYRTITTGLSLTPNSNQNTLNKLLKNLNELIIEKNLSQTTGKNVEAINRDIKRLEALHHVMKSKQEINAIYKPSLGRQIDTCLTQLRNFRSCNPSFLPSPPPIVRV